MKAWPVLFCLAFFSFFTLPAHADDQHAALVLNDAINVLKNHDYATAARLAEGSWQEASPQAPFRESILTVLMASYQRLEDYGKIQEYGDLALAALTAEQPHYMEKKTGYLELLGLAALKKEDYAACKRYYNQLYPLLESLPAEERAQRAGAYVNTAYCYMQGEEIGTARQFYQQALALLKTNPEQNSGLIAGIEHNLEVLDSLNDQKAIVFLPSAKKFFQAGEAAFKESDKIAAMNNYQEALNITVKNQGAKSAAVRLLQRRLKEAQAIETTHDYLHLLDIPFSRWRTKTVVVYIEDGSELGTWKAEYPDLVKKALSQWQQVLRNGIVFEYSDNRRDYDVKISWTEGCLENSVESKIPDACVGGVNRKETWDRYLAKNDIEISLSDGDGNPRSEESIYSVMLHETGHMMGLTNHSNNPSDVMFPYMQSDWKPVTALSGRDFNTLLALYSLRPGIANPKRYRLSHFDDFRRSVSGAYVLDSGPLVSFEDDEDEVDDNKTDAEGTDGEKKKKKKRRRPHTNRAPIWVPNVGPGFF